MPNPFAEHMNPDEQWLDRMAEKQDKYERKLIQRIMLHYGTYKSRVWRLFESVDSGITGTGVCFDWFNEAAAFPVKFTARRFVKKRTVADVYTEISTAKYSRMRELSSLRAFADSWPDEHVALISRYVGRADELVFHTSDSWRPSGYALVRRLADDVCLYIESLKDFLTEIEWDPSELSL